ncbi:hypothetical protein [uncultured Cocleimonas sp.]|uniref:hypothetical protein n=1 Tax=uncultured Cocleimonas sp. TaxID=1051587 RepID=UPI0026265ACF|nr:hypothetical protein [uncultured Cocleimonas sp.]
MSIRAVMKNPVGMAAWAGVNHRCNYRTWNRFILRRAYHFNATDFLCKLARISRFSGR